MADLPFDLSGKRVWIAGHQGMVGKALIRRLGREGCELIAAPRAELDLTDRRAVLGWLHNQRPKVVVLAAAKVGSILANATQPVEFLQDNLQIAANALAAAEAVGVEKLLFLGSSCIYPRDAAQPIKEEALLTGPLEPTNEAYALAKIAGIKLAQAYRQQYGCDFISAMPTNLYGPGDSYDLATSHVLPALIRKVHEAKLSGGPVEVWGSGTPRREFLHVDDCADACVHLLIHWSEALPINVGAGEDIAILELTQLVMEVIGYDGPIVHDRTKPDGTPRKLLDCSRLTALGWQPKIGLREGISSAYRAFTQGEARGV